MSSCDVTYLIIDESSFQGIKESIITTLRNSSKIIIIDKGNVLEDNDKLLRDTILSPKIELYKEVVDPICTKITEALGDGFVFKKGVYPFDLIVTKDGNKVVFIKITFNQKKYNDILEESHMISDSEYDNVTKLIISVDDLYFDWENTIKNVKDVINNG